MCDQYEVRRVGEYYHVVHIRTGYVVEKTRYEHYAHELCRRHNGIIN